MRRQTVRSSMLAAGAALGVGLVGWLVPSTLSGPQAAAQSNNTAVEPAAAGKTVKAQLLAINDFHGHLESKGLSISARTATSHGPGYVPAGGAAYLAAKLKQLKRENKNSLVVSAGDMVGASPMISGYFHDEPTVEAMNKMVDVGAVGNHEFDEGSKELRRMVNGGCGPSHSCAAHTYKGVTFDLLAANVVVRRTGKPMLPPTVVRSVGGAKIGFIGVTTIDTPKLLIPSGVVDIAFLDPVETIRKYAPRLRAQGADAVVVIAHEGAAQNDGSTSKTSGINACDDVRGPVVDITKAVASQVDAVVSGHTHKAYNCRVDGTLLTEAATYGRLVTKIDLTIDTGAHQVVKSSAKNVVVDHDRKPDAAVAKVVKTYEKLIATKASKSVGTLTKAADRAPSRSGETRLGGLVADAQLAATRKTKAKAQLAIVQRGVLRGDLPKGKVTTEDVYLAQPQAVKLITKTFTGKQLDAALEGQFCNDASTTNDRMVPLNPSANFTYRYDTSKPCGKRIRMADTTLDGKAITSTGKYRVTINAFLAAGVDGMAGFAEGTKAVTGVTDQQALTQYLKAKKTVTPPSRTRVRPL
ncbi:bifunctional metallophosphatase/5'-nucleotidase [Spongisporangium articulatum]|uniref:Bifunctional metallophosphatase/5'-nucleotidase n=1 Tax=Spongisporangium articulatum TaxID=3362603 RepID=A0ABW8AMH4_9ACTN